MNGGLPFVYIATCGCVLSQAGLKAMSNTGASSTPPPSDEEKNGEMVKVQLDLCPQCGAKYDRLLDIRTLNPDKETEETMRLAMELRKRQKGGKDKSKSKKRKAEEPNADKDSTEAKKAKPAPSMNPSIAATSRAVVDSLAAEETKRKAGMSDAVRSLYESNGTYKESFMTRTFNRVSHF
jgi:hypothetical protein